MKVHNLIQGTPEWHAYRRQHFNASHAPAMMGCSPHKKRSQLIAELATGIEEDVSEYVEERVHAPGHRFEALARPLAEQIIGEDLYPVVGSEGKLSASFDGLTLDESTAYEHKSLNDRLREAMVDGCTGADLPLDYQVQMEQQHMVSKCARVLFIASKWDGDQLVEARHCWYYPNPALAAQIAAGWEQLEADVCAFVPPATTALAPVAEPVKALPAVSVKVEGQIAVSSNLQVFETALRDFIEHRLIREPKTDQDFANLDTQIKAMKGAEAALASSDSNMLAQIQPVDTALKHSATLAKLVKEHRLMAEKLLTSEKDRRRMEIVHAGQQGLREHIAALNERLGKPYMPTVPADFAAAVKGMRNISNMEDAVTALLVNSKLQASAIADKIDANLKVLRETAADHAFLFADTAQIVLKAPDDFALLVKARVSDHQAAEAAREAALKEKAEREAREDLEHRRAAVAAIRWPEPEPVAAPAAVQVAAPVTLSLVAANDAARAAIAQECVETAQVYITAAAPLPRGVTTSAAPIKWINTATLAERLGLPSITSALAEELGFPGVRRGGPGLWWDDRKVRPLGEALIQRIRSRIDHPVAA